MESVGVSSESDFPTDPVEMSKRLEGTNISPQTFLATDYLNHFNEVVMLIEMLGDMPDMFEDVESWAPKSYQDHFRDSMFSDKELAIAAYDMAPAEFKVPFDATIKQADDVVFFAVQGIRYALDAGDEQRVAMIATNTSRVLQKLIDVASGIIHGSGKGMSQSEVDAYLGI